MALKLALFHGSFDPFHEGHLEIASKALQVFDKIIILLAVNPDKNKSSDRTEQRNDIHEKMNSWNFTDNSFEIHHTDGLIVDFITQFNIENEKKQQIVSLVRGIRNTNDFIYEQAQQYFNEDLGLDIPIMYCISSRTLVHYSSSAIRSLKKFEVDL